MREIRYQLQKKLQGFQEGSRPGQFWANCPFCIMRGEVRQDYRRRLGISINSKMFAVHCFNCGYSSNPLKLLKDLGIKRVKLSARSLLRLVKEEEEHPPIELPKENRLLAFGTIIHRAPLRYLGERGITLDLIRRFQVGYCARGDYARRVIFPIYHQGTLVGFQGRIITEDKKRKYRFPPGFDASNYLFNFDSVIYSQMVVIVEGIFDVLALPNQAVAIFSNKLSDHQRYLIVRTWKRAIVMLDSEEGKRADLIVRALAPFMKVKRAALASGDPGDAPREELLRAINQAGDDHYWGNL